MPSAANANGAARRECRDARRVTFPKRGQLRVEPSRAKLVSHFGPLICAKKRSDVSNKAGAPALLHADAAAVDGQKRTILHVPVRLLLLLLRFIGWLR
jgi:hypothetical protein